MKPYTPMEISNILTNCETKEDCLELVEYIKDNTAHYLPIYLRTWLIALTIQLSVFDSIELHRKIKGQNEKD